MVIHIAKSAEVLTLINTFHCAPANQATIVASLQTFTSEVTKAMPGYFGVAVHTSADGTHVLGLLAMARRGRRPSDA